MCLLFLKTKLGGNVLQITVLYIAGHNSRGSGLNAPAHDMNAFEVHQSLLSQISCAPQRLLQIQPLYRCFIHQLWACCALCTACPPHWPSPGDSDPLLPPQGNARAGLSQQSFISAPGCHGPEARKPLSSLLLILLPLAQRGKEGKEVSLLKCQTEISSFKDKRYGGGGAGPEETDRLETAGAEGVTLPRRG